MKFNEQLVYTRERKKLSQTELAEKILVSRSTIEDWESGKTQPDIENLNALATALNVSVDHLCGHNSDVAVLSSNNMHKVIKLFISIIIAAAVFFGGFTIGSSLKSTINSLKEQIPDTVSASGVSFSFDGKSVTYRFAPSVTGEHYSYKICFIDYSDKEYVFDVKEKGGVCSGRSVISSFNIASVTYSVTNLKETRTALIATNLDLDTTGTTWNTEK